MGFGLLKNIQESYDRGFKALEGSPERRAELVLLGEERVLLYKTLILTGLRKGELASITLGQTSLETKVPFIEVDIEDEKSGDAATIPLRPDLTEELRQWVQDKQRRYREQHEGVICDRHEPRGHVSAALRASVLCPDWVGSYSQQQSQSCRYSQGGRTWQERGRSRNRSLTQTKENPANH